MSLSNWQEDSYFDSGTVRKGTTRDSPRAAIATAITEARQLDAETYQKAATLQTEESMAEVDILRGTVNVNVFGNAADNSADAPTPDHLGVELTMTEQTSDGTYNELYDRTEHGAFSGTIIHEQLSAELYDILTENGVTPQGDRTNWLFGQFTTKYGSDIRVSADPSL
jgi:hypothetical protein